MAGKHQCAARAEQNRPGDCTLPAISKELVYPADVVINSYVTHLGRTSMKMDHEFLLARRPNDLCHRARGTGVGGLPQWRQY